jgi:hypothetical protein
MVSFMEDLYIGGLQPAEGQGADCCDNGDDDDDPPTSLRDAHVIF